MTDSNYQVATSSSQIGSSLPVEMLEAAAQGLIAFDGEHPSAPWEFYAEAALKAAGVLALLDERDDLLDFVDYVLAGRFIHREGDNAEEFYALRDSALRHRALRGGSE